MATVSMQHGLWIKEFDDRQRQEIDLAIVYAQSFAHGTTGHNQLMIIAKFAAIMDYFYRNMPEPDALDMAAIRKELEMRIHENRNP